MLDPPAISMIPLAGEAEPESALNSITAPIEETAWNEGTAPVLPVRT